MGQTLLVDAPSIFAFQQHLKQQDYPIQGNINYGALLEALQLPPQASNRPRPLSVSGSRTGVRTHSVVRSEASASPVTFDKMFAFVAINPEHDGQQKFCAFLRGQGFTVDETDFRRLHHPHARQFIPTALNALTFTWPACWPLHMTGMGNHARYHICWSSPTLSTRITPSWIMSKTETGRLRSLFLGTEWKTDGNEPVYLMRTLR